MPVTRLCALSHSECAICCEEYGTTVDRKIVTPLILNCGHDFCSQCTARIRQDRKCPTCRQRFDYFDPRKPFVEFVRVNVVEEGSSKALEALTKRLNEMLSDSNTDLAGERLQRINRRAVTMKAIEADLTPLEVSGTQVKRLVAQFATVIQNLCDALQYEKDLQILKEESLKFCAAPSADASPRRLPSTVPLTPPREVPTLRGVRVVTPEPDSPINELRRLRERHSRINMQTQTQTSTKQGDSSAQRKLTRQASVASNVASATRSRASRSGTSLPSTQVASATPHDHFYGITPHSSPIRQSREPMATLDPQLRCRSWTRGVRCTTRIWNRYYCYEHHPVAGQTSILNSPDGMCRGTTKKEERCRWRLREGSGPYCHWHDVDPRAG